MLLYACWGFSVAAHAERYDVTRLSNSDSTGQNVAIGADALNDKGEIVAGGSVNGRPRAYLWRCGKLTDLGDLMADESSVMGFGINNRTQIAGSSKN